MVRDAGWSLVFVEPFAIASTGLSKDHFIQLPRADHHEIHTTKESLEVKKSMIFASVKDEDTQLGQLVCERHYTGWLGSHTTCGKW